MKTGYVINVRSCSPCQKTNTVHCIGQQHAVYAQCMVGR